MAFGRTNQNESVEEEVVRAPVMLTRAQRIEAGRSARATAPRKSHATWEPSRMRRDPLQLLDEQNRRRFPDLVALRWGRMVASPFTFFRGAAAVMAADLASTPQSGLWAQSCGDAHCQNFGLFASPERHLLFDLNDFDETLPGPWEWDVKRLTTSVVLALRDEGYSDADAMAGAVETARAYRIGMAKFAEMSALDIWYSKVDIDEFIPEMNPANRKFAAKVAQKARRRTTLQALGKLTEVVDGVPRIVDDPPIVEHLPDSATDYAIASVVDRYRETLSEDRRLLFDRYEIIDVARKVVGVGSVGTHCWIALLSANKERDDLLFLQIKEANMSVMEPYLGNSEFANHGQRVVVGQRLMQAASDVFLGWSKFRERHYYIRQLRDMKGSVDLSTMSSTLIGQYGAVCGETLARAHARSGDPVAIAAYLGNGDNFDKAVAQFSMVYADQSEQDHALLRKAIDEGRFEAIEGL